MKTLRFILPLLLAVLSPGQLDAQTPDSFAPNANSHVYSVVPQSDGKVLVGGNFTTVGGVARNYIARLNVDGSLDSSFNPDANNQVRAMAVQADGKILVGGHLRPWAEWCATMPRV